MSNESVQREYNQRMYGQYRVGGKSYTGLAAARAGGSGLLNQADILKKLQNKQRKANEANEARYQEILGMYGNLGQAGMARIGQAEQQAMASGTQDLASRGLGNTTIRGSMARGVASDAELARQQLGESVATQKAGVMERRTDEGPDMGLYSNLLMQAAQGQQRSTGGSSFSIAPIPSQMASTPQGRETPGGPAKAYKMENGRLVPMTV